MVYVHNNKLASFAFISYTYNAVGALQAVRRNPLVDPSAVYTYDGDRVTSISHGETVYSYEYDGYGNCTEIKVGTQPLRTTSYNQNQTINTITYGNGDTVSYTYDDDKNISTISFDGGTTVAYRYEYEDGELTKIYDYVNLLVSRYTKSDDGSSSAFQINKFTQSGSTITEGEQIYGTTYSSENNTTTVNVFGKTYSYETLDDSYNSLEDTVTSCVKATVNGKTLEHSTTTDFFDRKVSEKSSLSSNSASLNTTYSYKEKNNYETTQLNGINVTLGDRPLFNEVYTYDDSGNITLIENSSGKDLYKYTYDVQQQITAEYNFVLGTATTYTYDDFGNILTKTPYTNVTSDDLSTATVGETKSYTYDTTWTDKLTSFGGESIVYDEIGNPTTYRGATLTWEGRQLMSYSKDGTNISYQYNADGLRTKQLKHDSQGRVSIEITYIWDNGQLVGYTSTLYDYSAETGTTSNSFDAKIHYDEASEPYAVTLGENTYYYIRNAVGDVKGVINADTGEYVYALNTSAYGVLSFVEPDLTFDTAGLIPDQIIQIIQQMQKLALQLSLCLPTANTYKGYSYDIFTGLYYLQSRYYDPEVGRFINADDVDYLGVGNRPLSYNLFAYCENNPVNNSDSSGYFGTPIQWAFSIIGAILGIPFGKWIANRLGYTKGWRYNAIRIAAVVGGAALGWFAGRTLIKLVNAYITSNPGVLIKIVSRFGPKTLINFKTIFGINNKIIISSALKSAISQTIKNVSKFTVSKKHLKNAGGNFNKFKTDSQAEVRKLITQALKSKNNIIRIELNSSDSYYVIVDMGREIGTKGEKFLKIIFTFKGKIISAYPVKK
jgi:RHS repeat-associated protein